MLEKIREGATGFWAKVILGVVALSFVFAGVGSYITSSNDVPAALVNGDTISTVTFERAYQAERNRMESQLGDAFAQLANNPQYLQGFRQDVLTRLVNDKLIDQKAKNLGLRVSDEQLRKTLLEMPEFQVGGQFNNDRFQALIRQAGFSPAEFRDYLRTELTRQQLSRAVALSEFALPSEAESILKLQKQTRDARYVTINKDLFVADTEVSQEELQSYYNENIADFDTEETVSVEFIELKANDLVAEAVVAEDEILTYYEENSASYISEAQVRTSHILVELGEDEAAAETRANDLLAQIKNGADFAELANSSSDDTFSGEQGGDLDWFGKDVMDPAFEEAAFALANIGDVSDVVRSEFGFHIIKLTDVKPEQVEPLENVREDITTFLKEEKATERYIELQQEMASLAFEIPENLDEIAVVLNSEIQTTESVSRNSATGTLANQEVLAALFSPELIEDGVNSDVIDIADDHSVVVRVASHQPQRTQSLEEVTAVIREALVAEKAQEQAKAWAETLAGTVVENEEQASALLTEKTLEWNAVEAMERFGSGAPREVSSEVFKMAVANELKTVELFNGDVALVQLLAINETSAVEESEKSSTQERLASNNSQQSYQSLITALNDAAEVELSVQ
ncbi:MAG: peptidylprolyl isomerase [Alteromonadaceae bacterium]|nr:peptidylprolyl isomerase [Alteromonadaceae bacterium]